MKRGLKARAKQIMAGACAVLAIAGLGGCSSVPTRSEYKTEAATQAISDDNLVTAGTLTVAFIQDNAPQSIKADDGTLSGYAVDVAYALGERLGLKVTFVNSASASDALGSKKADVFIGAETDSKSNKVTISGTYLEDAIAIFGDASSDSVSVSSLSSATIGVQGSSASQDQLGEAGITGTQQTYDDLNSCFAALGEGKVDYVACNAAAGSYLARVYSGVDFIGTIGESSTTCVATLSSASAVTEAVSGQMETMESDGTLDAIHTKWFGSMPLSLSDSAVSGVDVASSGSSNSSSSSSISSSSSSDSKIGDSINQLSS